MTVFIWIDENGEWKVTHLPPHDGSPFIRVMCTDLPVFFDDTAGKEIVVTT
jgi:hypothetical protein